MGVWLVTFSCTIFLPFFSRFLRLSLFLFPCPSLADCVVDQDGKTLTLDSLSFLVGYRVKHYLDLPDFPEEATPSSLRQPAGSPAVRCFF